MPIDERGAATGGAGGGPLVERIVGRIRADAPGPTMIVMTGIHGNEPSGAIAARRLLERIERDGIAVRGELVVLAGNMPALARGVRFIDDDLNRQWTRTRMTAIRARVPEEDTLAEDGQRRELREVFSAIVAQARGPIYFLDLHTSSAEGAPFLTVGDTLRNRRFALRLPLPIMLGLEEQVDGSLLEYLNNRGFVTLGVEAGQHDAPSSAERHEAVLWLAAGEAGLIERDAVPDAGERIELLRRAAEGIPTALEVRYRHPIVGDDSFRMEPGYTNFDPVERGNRLASDRRGPIEARETGRILLPLYQSKGDDGFFVVREFSPFWLTLSAGLRRLPLPGLLPLMPGIHASQDAGDGDVLVVNTRIARFFPLQIFHLFGYRKLRRSGDTLVVSRRRHDLAPPPIFAVE